MYLLIQIPIYACSAYFRLGSFSLSCIFFSYWTIIPMLLIVCIYGSIAASQSLDIDDAAVLVISNMSVMCMGPISRQDENGLKKSRLFLFRSSIACSVMHSTVLGILLFLINGTTDTELFTAG